MKCSHYSLFIIIIITLLLYITQMFIFYCLPSLSIFCTAICALLLERFHANKFIFISINQQKVVYCYNHRQ